MKSSLYIEDIFINFINHKLKVDILQLQIVGPIDRLPHTPSILLILYSTI